MTTEISSCQLSGVYSWIARKEAQVHAHMRLVCDLGLKGGCLACLILNLSRP